MTELPTLRGLAAANCSKSREPTDLRTRALLEGALREELDLWRRAVTSGLRGLLKG